MEKQTIIFTALPNGRDPADGALRLSVFISPRLWTDDPAIKKLKLAQFPDFLDWTARITPSSWQVTFEGGPTLPATVASAAPRADLWSALFKTDTDVLPFQFDDHRGTIIETTPTDKIHDFLVGIYVRAGSEPTYGQGSNLPTIETLANDSDLSEIARPSQPERPVSTTPSREPIDLHGTIPPSDPEPIPVPAPDGGPHGCGWSACGCLLWPFAILARLFPFLDPIFAKIFGGGKASIPSRAGEDPPAYPSAPFPTPPPPAPPSPPPVELPRETMPPWTLPLTANQEAFTKLTAFVKPWNDVSVPLPTAEDLKDIYDFHQMMASLGDYPKLLRLLGLVVDLRIAPGGAAPPASGTVKVSPGIGLNPAGKIITPRTHYEITPSGFGAKPRPVNSEISNGFLQLNDTSRFQIVQVDAVGAGIKVQNMATNFRAFATKKKRSPNMPDDAGLPALRTGGISVVRRNLIEDIRTTFDRSHALQLALAALDLSPLPPPPAGAGVALPPSDELFAEDLVRGYRIDVFDDRAKTWHSLCQRVGTYYFLEAPDAPGGKVSLDLEDEGFVQFSATKPTTPPAQPLLKATDALFVWDGWSLCAPRPGKSIMPDKKDAIPNAKGEIPVRLEKPKNEAITKFKLETAFRAKEGSLPRFRFDYTYRLRARVCDLAGNSVHKPDAPGESDPDFKNDVAEQTADFPCARFEPVAPPAMMLRARPVEGESLERLVVRSPAVAPTDKTTERHIVPPKVSQLMAEQHGRFDLKHKMDDGKPGYDLAAREAGALEDGAVEVFTSDPILGETPPSKVWVQAANKFPLTYLPDPCSRGAVLLGLSGGPGEIIVEPGTKIVNKIPFDDPLTADLWPDRLPFRLRLVAVPRGTPPAEPKWTADRVLTVEIPEAEKRIVRLSSYFTSEDLDRQGVWQWMEENVPATLAQIKKDTIAGRSWLHLPWRELTLIHPVLKPLDAPSVVDPLKAAKNLGATAATITGEVQSDAASTGKVDLFAAWTDPLDDPAQPAPTTRDQRAHLCEVFVPEGAAKTAILDSVKHKPALHHFGDTKFHSVIYTPVATTRFREYFPRALTDDAKNVTLKGAPSTAVKILNSARPDAPKVLYVVPTFAWDEDTAVTGTTKRIRKGGGLRVYLDRPWYSSGEGELLGVLFRENENFTSLTEDLKPLVTQWGVDPIWLSQGAAHSAAREKHFINASPSAKVTLAEVAQGISVVGYKVEFDGVRKLWFADIELDLGPSYTPFVRLALVRFQPDSVKDAEISRVVRAEFAQLAPDRTASVATTSSGAGSKFKLVVTGPTYVASAATEAAANIGKESERTGRAEIEALLQKRDPNLGA
ncbi:MAG: hypothetical protein M3N48_09890, partial [Verrucomicrobiota bacterium]|nr:hypothetical protein [Verrucomicrobiota bacterium]